MNDTAKLRTVFVFFLFCSLFSITIIHLYGLQITQHTFFADLGKKQYYLTLTTYPPRALIFDRHGVPLALNKESLSAFIMPHHIKDRKKLTHFLQAHFPTALTRLEEKKHAYFVYVKRRLTHEEQQLIQDEAIQDIHFLTEPSRFYPLDSAGAITGITNTDNRGLFGIELLYNTQLAGTPTTTILEKDARSGLFYFSKQTSEEGTQGESVTLTIDGDLQFLVKEELMTTITKYQAKQGGVVIMDPETGDVLAMASYPTFDPNNSHSMDLATTKNIPVTESYEFGSAFKAFFALAALEEEITSPDELIDCHNTETAYVEGRRVNTVPSSAAGIITFSEVIQRSNNIGVAKVAKRCESILYDHYNKMGFGHKTNIEFPGEQSGFLMHPRNWSKQSVISLSYGYEVTATLIRLATAFCIFANDGCLIEPHLVSSPTAKQQKGQKIYSTQAISAMRTILQETAKEGTGRYAQVKGYLTMGKTSTANLLENGQYNPHKNLYGFVGSIEHGPYKRVIACFVKESPRHNLYAATVAAPLFERIAEKMLLHDKIL
jgi:cell division protein FtsI (penicillin-binding protein 3)